MEQKPKISFAEILNTIDDADSNCQFPSSAAYDADVSPLAIPQDVFSLSLKAQNLFGGKPVTAPKNNPNALPKKDLQGNQVFISSEGQTLAQTAEEAVAWETGSRKKL